MLIAGPNLTLDRLLWLDEIRPGQVLRSRSARVTAGGKGPNVARAVLGLGAPAVLVGFVPGHTGRAVAGLLAEEGISLCAVPSGGEVRSTAVLLEDSGRATVVNEPGPAIGGSEWTAFEEAVCGQLQGGSALVCAGSVPPGAPVDAYARFVAAGRRAGCLTIVDATGALLRAALAERPDVVAPNVSEAAEALGWDVPGGPLGADEACRRAFEAGRALLTLGARAAVISAGASGLALVSDGGARWLPAVRVPEVRNPVGAGDALVGGLVVALQEGRALDEAVRFGAAVAAASVERPVPGEVVAERVPELLASATWTLSET
jgi:1-phosphofructokinase family hexose kinase